MKYAISLYMTITSKKSTWLLSLIFIASSLLSTDLLAQRGKQSDNDKPRKPLISQDEYNKLLMWIVDEKYENVLYKCIRYTEGDKTKKLPLPYVYMAQAYLGIHSTDDHDLREQYQADKNKALKNSLKYTSKFVKKDKEKEYYHEFIDFFDQLRKEAKNAAETEMDNLKFTKAKSYYKYLTDIDPEDPGAWLMFAAVYKQLNSKKEALENYEKARNLMLDFGGRGLSEVQTELLHFAIIYNAELLSTIDRAAALEWLALGDDLFSGDREFEAVKRSIGG
jgi:tetratricopeptide (TPR) repeat protein